MPSVRSWGMRGSATARAPKKLISAAVGRANTEPAVAHLLIMDARAIDGGRQIEHLRCQPAHRVQDAVGRDHAIMLRGAQRATGIDQRLLGVEPVVLGALPPLALSAHPVPRAPRPRPLL